jgi:putative ABC transport system permease protein
MSSHGYGLWMLARRSLRQHAFSTAITAASLALACGLVMAVLGIRTQSQNAFLLERSPFDAVLGVRSSATQLVLNSVFHLETSPGNLPWASFEEIRKAPGVRAAIPYAVGDNWRGFRIVGTTAEQFDDVKLKGRAPRVEPGGRVFDEELREAVLGSFVAQKTGVRVGDTIHPSHGPVTGGDEHDEDYVVVGVLEATNTPADRVVWIPIEGMFRMEGHVLRGDGEEYHAEHHEEIPEDKKEVSAVMLAFDSPQAGLMLDQRINRDGKDATLAWPVSRVVLELFDKIGWMSRVLELVAYATVLVAAASILASLYDAMAQRRRELAILRAIGATRAQLFATVVLQATTIAALGALFGVAVYFAILLVAREVIRAQTGVVLDPAEFDASVALVPAGVIAIGALCGVLPAWKAYSVEVAEDLAPST